MRCTLHGIEDCLPEDFDKSFGVIDSRGAQQTVLEEIADILFVAWNTHQDIIVKSRHQGIGEMKSQRIVVGRSKAKSCATISREGVELCQGTGIDLGSTSVKSHTVVEGVGEKAVAESQF